MVKIRVSYESRNELDRVLDILKDSGNEPEKVKISEKRSGKYARAYLELHPDPAEKGKF